MFDAERPHYAAWLRVHDIDEFWLSFTPDSNIPRAEPLYYAALCGFYDLATHLIAKHPEHVNATGGQKVTPLAAALYGNHFEVAELLYQHGADIHVRGDGIRTLLHVASLKGLIDVVQWLLEHGADTDSRQNDLFTSPRCIWQRTMDTSKWLACYSAISPISTPRRERLRRRGIDAVASLLMQDHVWSLRGKRDCRRCAPAARPWCEYRCNKQEWPYPVRSSVTGRTLRDGRVSSGMWRYVSAAYNLTGFFTSSFKMYF